MTVNKEYNNTALSEDNHSRLHDSVPDSVSSPVFNLYLGSVYSTDRLSIANKGVQNANSRSMLEAYRENYDLPFDRLETRVYFFFLATVSQSAVHQSRLVSSDKCNPGINEKARVTTTSH